MKKVYEVLTMEILLLSATDIVTFSDNYKDDVGDDIFTPNN